MAASADNTFAPGDRRRFLKGAMTTAAMVALIGPPAIKLNPTVFDPVAWIRDMRAAGVSVSVVGDSALSLYSAEGFGDDYMDVCWKWAHARKACPDSNDLTITALLQERAD